MEALFSYRGRNFLDIILQFVMFYIIILENFMSSV